MREFQHLDSRRVRALPNVKSHPGLLLIVRRTYFRATGPGRKWAWLVDGRMSRTSRTVYALGKTFRRLRHRSGAYRSTHVAIENGLEYYIRGMPSRWRALRYLFDLDGMLDLSEGEEV